MTIIREPINAISHGVGAIAALIGLVFLLLVSHSPLQYTVALIYGVSLIFLYTASALYHGLGFQTHVRTFFSKLDHAAIYCLIAGTATPVAVLIMNDWSGWLMFGLMWGLAGVGAVVTMLKPVDSPYLRSALYLVLGWTPIYFIDPLLASLSTMGLILVAAGGIVYSIGAMIYMFDWPRLSVDYFGSHELWHMFTIVASAIHFVFISVYAF